jgi:hypothetical protein
LGSFSPDVSILGQSGSGIVLILRQFSCIAHTLKSQNTIAEDLSTHGAMLVLVFSGSDKTTVSVTTGHQGYHPVYASAGNISNTAWWGHGNAVVPVAFLPILKSM